MFILFKNSKVEFSQFLKMDQESFKQFKRNYKYFIKKQKNCIICLFFFYKFNKFNFFH